MLEKKQQLIDYAVKSFQKLRENDKTVEPEDGLVWAMEELSAPELTHEEYDSLVHSVNSACLLKGIWSPAPTDAPYEYLPAGLLDEAYGDFSACEGKWQRINETQYNVFLTAPCCVVRKPEEDVFREANEYIDTGKVLSIPIGYIRKATSEKKCPKCGASVFGIGALSRIDNKTVICSECGTAEALEDYGGCIQ